MNLPSSSFNSKLRQLFNSYTQPPDFTKSGVCSVGTFSDFYSTHIFDVSLCRRVRMRIQNPTKRPKRRRNTENDHDRRVGLVTYQNFLNLACCTLEESADLIAS